MPLFRWQKVPDPDTRTTSIVQSHSRGDGKWATAAGSILPMFYYYYYYYDTKIQCIYCIIQCIQKKKE